VLENDKDNQNVKILINEHALLEVFNISIYRFFYKNTKKIDLSLMFMCMRPYLGQGVHL